MPLAAGRSIDKQFPEMVAQTARRDAEFGLSYLEREFTIERSQALTQVAHDPNGCGFDGFHFDLSRRNLYLFVFSDSYEDLKQSLKRIIGVGLDRVFSYSDTECVQDQLLVQIKSCLAENEVLIERVCIHFVCSWDPRQAQRSQVLGKLREDLETKKHVIEKYFNRPTTLLIEFRSARTRMAVATTQLRNTHSYAIHLTDTIMNKGPMGESMVIGFLPLTDLYSIYLGMGTRFFDRNIRSALAESGMVNSSIRQALREIVLDGKCEPATFAFNHNGITLYAEAISRDNAHFTVIEPRVLNGAQTVISLARFIEEIDLHKRGDGCQGVLSQVHVLSRVITNASQSFVTNVTISNNRQNPVHPWNLRANDMIQLELQDKLRDEVGVYYERQQNTFAQLTDDDLAQQGITQYRPIDILRLARTFLASEGQIDTLARFHEVFEDDRTYQRVFDKTRLKIDSRKIILCYKIQFCLRRLVNEVMEKGADKYTFASHARTLLWSLLCQAVLNDSDLETLAQDFGRFLGLESHYKEWLSNAATTKCRFLLSDLATCKSYASKAAEGDFSFMRTTAGYKRSMESAHKRWGWTEKRLR